MISPRSVRDSTDALTSEVRASSRRLCSPRNTRAPRQKDGSAASGAVKGKSMFATLLSSFDSKKVTQCVTLRNVFLFGEQNVTNLLFTNTNMLFN
jgi:hypothetical protein